MPQEPFFYENREWFETDFKPDLKFYTFIMENITNPLEGERVIDNNHNGIVDSVEDDYFNDNTKIQEASTESSQTMGELYTERYYNYLSDNDIALKSGTDSIQISDDIDQFTDTDGDGLIDLLEKEITGLDENSDDSDGDGLDDLKEILIGSDPTNIDSDSDGLTDLFEFENSNLRGVDITTPYIDPHFTNSDTKTSFFDLFGSSKKDDDQDGLTNKLERRLGSKRNNIDSDGDRLTDAQEYLLGTDPRDPDSDDDGFTDFVDFDPLDSSDGLALLEKVMIIQDGENRTKFNNFLERMENKGGRRRMSRDPDGDGLTNLIEGRRSKRPPSPRGRLETLKTTPHGDGDASNDFEEITGLTISAPGFHTDNTLTQLDYPIYIDPETGTLDWQRFFDENDYSGWSDYIDVHVPTYSSHPLLTDTDRDYIPDDIDSYPRHSN